MVLRGKETGDSCRASRHPTQVQASVPRALLDTAAEMKSCDTQRGSEAVAFQSLQRTADYSRRWQPDRAVIYAPQSWRERANDIHIVRE